MSDMPMKIWAYVHDCDRGRIYTEDEPVRSGFFEAPEPYINAEQLVEELEGMKDNQVQHLGNFPMVATWNAAIDAILEKIDERVEQP